MKGLHTECKASIINCLIDGTISIDIGPKKWYANIHNYRDLVMKEHDFIVSITE